MVIKKLMLKTCILGIGSLLLSSSLTQGQELVISEFLTSNQTSLEDEDGDEEDWIEIYNPGSATINLEGWHLTDDAENLSRWAFPEVTLAPGEYLIVFASDKNRKDPAGTLHTNFKLSSSGEYLALVRPDGRTVEHDFGPTYPLQVTDVSFGLRQETTPIEVVPNGLDSRYLVPSSGEHDVQDGANVDSWITKEFDDRSWGVGPSGYGFALTGGDPYDDFINTDLEASMWPDHTSVYLRIPFTLEDPSGLTELTLRMMADDGFVAYLNGDPEPIAELNSPSPDQLAFDSRATNSNSDPDALAGAEFAVNVGLLNPGSNLLCIHGLNRSASNSDALFVALLEGSVVTSSLEQAYFQSPTPNAPNREGEDTPGPLIRRVTSGLPPIDPSLEELLIEADVVQSVNPLGEVSLRWRVMYQGESSLAMVDDGTGSDRIAGDGIYTASIPLASLSAGQMLRWRVVAMDQQSNATTAPSFDDPRDSPEYFGTIAQDPSVDDSNLPVLHWFTASPAGSETVGGARGSIYYLGEFYDNIQADRHGQSTGGFPKKSFDIDFNKGERFRPYEGGPRAKDINLLTNWADKSKTRNTIGYEIMRKAGHPAHYAFPVRVQQNARFFSIADLVEDGDDRYLERVGLDGEGALYKMYNRLDSSSSGVNKKTRKDEGNADLAALIAGLGLGGDARLRYGYDNLNIPETINYLAAIDMTNNRDHGHKNYYLYRDTNGTGEWCPLVWDIDLCLGRNWRSGIAYFDDVFTNNSLRAGASNRLKQFVFNDPTLDSLYLRRLRTLMDEMLGGPDAPLDNLGGRVRDLVALIDPGNDSPSSGSDDADLDYQKWGSWGNRNAMRPAADRIINEFIPTRRAQLYSLAQIPPAQNPNVRIDVGEIEFDPVASGASDDQSGEYFVLSNPNSVAVDCSNWKISGGISMTLPPGSVVPANAVLHVAREAVGFRSRLLSPKADEKRYLVSGYGGQLSARGEGLVLSDTNGRVVQSISFEGSPTPSQRFLRVSEIHYHPSEPSEAERAALPGVSSEDFEYIELVNTGDAVLELEGVQFVDGIFFVFASGARLAPGEHLLLVANLEAFELRYGSQLPVRGVFQGQLDNGGESLQILDGAGENVLEFSFRDDWYPQADGLGRSLVLRDPLGTAVTDFDVASSWGVSVRPGGDPGVGSTDFALTFESWKSEVFSEGELADPMITGSEVDLDRDGLTLFEEYAFGMDPRIANKDAPYRAVRQELDGKEAFAMTYRSQSGAIDLVYQIESSVDLLVWSGLSNRVGEPVDEGGGVESVTVGGEFSAIGEGARFLRLRVFLSSR
jgi:hypothetical protein